MVNKIWLSLYNYFLWPLLYVAARALSLFQKKIAKVFKGRKKVLERWQQAMTPLQDKKVIWFHVASAGEFLQAIPLLRLLEQYKAEKNLAFVVSYYSPSCIPWLREVKSIDVADYLPFDFRSTQKRFVKLINPQILLLVKYDLWPNLVDTVFGEKKNIFLVAATLPLNRARAKNFIVRSFYRQIYSKLTKIFSITQDDEANIKKAFDIKNIQTVGDTKVDIVLQRVKQFTDEKNSTLEYFCKSASLTIVIGSCWRADLELVASASDFIKEKNIKIIVVPHELEKHNLHQLESVLNQNQLRYDYINNIAESDAKNLNAVIVDQMGKLAYLYSFADAVVVGTGFGGVHNVLEPVALARPTAIRLAKYKHVPEAVALLSEGGLYPLVSVSDWREFLEKVLMQNEEIKRQVGQATHYIQSSQGAAQKIVEDILEACR